MEGAAKVTTSVHERLDQPGYVVCVTVDVGVGQRHVKMPVENFTDAEALAESFQALFSGPGGDKAAAAMLDGIEEVCG